MNWFKLLLHDLRCGVFRVRYFMAALLSMIPCIGFLHNATLMEVSPSWMDYLLMTFRGSAPVDPSNPIDIRSLPYDWLLMVGACLFLNLDYMLLDLTNNGQQVMIRSRSRQVWFLSKCAWNLSASAIYFLLIGLVELVFAAVSGGIVSAENTTESYMIIFGWVAFKPVQLSLQEGLILGLLLPYLTVAALSILEMTLCLIVKPVLSFLICMALLVLAVYVDSPFVLGNGAMTVRSSIIAADGQNPLLVALVAVGTILVCIIAGVVAFKNSDVLGSRE